MKTVPGLTFVELLVMYSTSNSSASFKILSFTTNLLILSKSLPSFNSTHPFNMYDFEKEDTVSIEIITLYENSSMGIVKQKRHLMAYLHKMPPHNLLIHRIHRYLIKGKIAYDISL